MQEYGYKEIGHLSQWKLGGQLLRGWFDKVYMPVSMKVTCQYFEVTCQWSDATKRNQTPSEILIRKLVNDMQMMLTIIVRATQNK